MSHEKWDVSIMRFVVFQIHVQSSTGSRSLKLPLVPYFVWANSKGSDGTAQMRRLAWAFAVCLCVKYSFLMGCLKFESWKVKTHKLLLKNSQSFGPSHDKPNKMMCAQQRLRSAWACALSDQSSLSAWRKLGSLATHRMHSEDSDHTERMPRLICLC